MRVPTPVQPLSSGSALPAHAWPTEQWNPIILGLRDALSADPGTGVSRLMPHLVGGIGSGTRALALAAAVHGVRTYRGSEPEVLSVDLASLLGDSSRWADVIRSQADVIRQQGRIPVLLAEGVSSAPPLAQRALAALWDEGVTVVAVSVGRPGQASVPLRDPSLASRTEFLAVHRAAQATPDDHSGVPSYRSSPAERAARLSRP